MRKKTFWFWVRTVTAVVVILFAAPEPSRAKEIENTMAAEQVQALAPVSLNLVDEAVSILGQGWSNMSLEEQETFLLLYDPAGTGEVDDQFAAQVLQNFIKIRHTLAGELEVVYAGDSAICEDQRLYFTDISRLYVCPYFFKEENELRKARTLIHESAHIALLAADRHYYRPTSAEYAALTPNGSPLNELPVVGRIFREVLRGDTLYHPDAYAHFALKSAGYKNIYAPT